MNLTFEVSSGSRHFLRFLAVSFDVFCFTWVALNPLGGQILNCNYIPLMVPRFSFFIEDLVVGCSYTTELDRAMFVAFLNCVCKQPFVIFVRLQISQFASLGKCKQVVLPF